MKITRTIELIRNLIQITGGYLFKLENPCRFCGEDNPKKLHFHHIDKTTKKFDISRSQGCTMTDFCNEVAKCYIYCRICHKKLHTGTLYKTIEYIEGLGMELDYLDPLASCLN